jgi:uncharacterized membrane protein YvbJ
VDKIKCHSCGTPLNDYAKYCSKCGIEQKPNEESIQDQTNKNKIIYIDKTVIKKERSGCSWILIIAVGVALAIIVASLI